MGSDTINFWRVWQDLTLIKGARVELFYARRRRWKFSILALHTTDSDLRRRLLLNVSDTAPAQLVELGEAYACRTGYPIQYQYHVVFKTGPVDRDAGSGEPIFLVSKETI